MRICVFLCQFKHIYIVNRLELAPVITIISAQCLIGIHSGCQRWLE